MYFIHELTHEISFPDPNFASPEGLLAIGGDLSTERLICAYQNGIFPWYNKYEPIQWWCPDPRFVLLPESLIVHKSMQSLFKKQKFRVTFDQAFETVITNCGQIRRKGQRGTWITTEMRKAYIKLHQEGFAHSVEVWEGNEIVGGLYGICLGKIFFGESMFTKVTDASKYGFITLVRALQKTGYTLIDCQQQTKHLESLGAFAMDRKTFLQRLKENDAACQLWDHAKMTNND